MKEYIKKFDSASDANDYAIADIPFTTSVATNPIQNLVCNQSGKKLVNINESLVIRSTPPKMIDLGLSVKWAATNIGAVPGSTKESYYGDYYAWGETETKSDYSWSTYKYANGAYDKLTKYCHINKTDYWGGEGSPDNKLILEVADDVANVTYGSNYHMPTQAESEELIALPKKWVTNFKDISGLNGIIFAKTQTELDGTFDDDTMLFIPAAGLFDGSTRNYTGSHCFLWSSSLGSVDPDSARELHFKSILFSLGSGSRCYGISVRCVSTAS